MTTQKILAVFLFFFMLGSLSPSAAAVMEASDKDASVRKLGVAWNIAQDRKMENISGVYEPEGLDKYMKRYFDQLSSKMDQLSAKVDKLSAQVTVLQELSTKKNSKASSQGRIV